MGWRLKIKHVTGFTYAGTAQASYNEARMTPLSVPGQTTLFSQVECTPGAATWRYRDYWGTQVTVFDLQRPHDQLRVTATSLVETGERTPPVVACDWGVLRSPSTMDRYVELLTPTELTTIDSDLEACADAIVRGSTPIEAALAIAEWVRANVTYMPGATGVRTSAQEAWAHRHGVCQDIAHLTLGMLRTVGIPARYVSGYFYPKANGALKDVVAGQSHAWVEWWCGDWTGFDPTNGMPAGIRHVIVARGRDYDDITPLKGVYHGAPSTDLGVKVELTRLA